MAMILVIRKPFKSRSVLNRREFAILNQICFESVCVAVLPDCIKKTKYALNWLYLENFSQLLSLQVTLPRVSS